MDKAEYIAIEKIKSMTQEQMIKYLLDCVKRSCDCFFHLLYKWREKYTSSISEKEAVAQCLLQMMLCNTKPIISLFDGINLIPENNHSIIDPVSMVAILRSVYERTYIFHNVFVEPESDSEKTIMFNLWKIRGLNNRQKIDNIPEIYTHKRDREKQEIEFIKQETESLLINLKLTEQARIKIKKEIKSESSSIKGYRFVKSQDGSIIDFETISLTNSPLGLFNDKDFTSLYKLLSWNAHPSFLGVLQFGQMFDEGADKSLEITILESLLFFHNKFITDFISVVSGAKEVFDNLSEQDKIIIMALNKH